MAIKEKKNSAESAQIAEPHDYSDVDITVDFMFSYIMRNPDICIALLECLFPDHKIQKVVYIYYESPRIKPARAQMIGCFHVCGGA